MDISEPSGRLDLTRSSAISNLILKLPTKAELKDAEPPTSRPQTPHGALQILEILMSIFQYLDSPALAHSAQVCRLWSDVALEILWKDLPTAFPLLQLYGLRSSITGHGRNTHVDKWDFGVLGPHIPAKRQQMYLPHVRSLAVRPKGRTCVAMHTLHQLSRIEFHLPNLETLHFTIGNSDDDFLGAIPFITSTLKSLTLSPLSMIPESGLPRFLDSVYNSPILSLEYLDVSGVLLKRPAAIETLGRFVQQQKSLRHLGVRLSNTDLFASACNQSEEHPSITSVKILYPSQDSESVSINDLDFVRPLSRFTGLKTLELGTSSTRAEITEKGISVVASACPTLLQLLLRGFLGAPALLVFIAGAFPWLDTLDITLCWRDAVWPELSATTPRFHKLKELYLRRDGDPAKWPFQAPLEMSEVRILSRLIIATCPNDSELFLPTVGSRPIEGPYIWRSCTSLAGVESAVLEVFRAKLLRTILWEGSRPTRVSASQITLASGASSSSEAA